MRAFCHAIAKPYGAPALLLAMRAIRTNSSHGSSRPGFVGGATPSFSRIIDIVIERERIGVMRQREGVALEA